MFEAQANPGELANFYPDVRGPSTPGRYRLHLRPVIEGHTWMEDVGAWFEVQNQMTNSRYMSQVDTQKSYDLGCELGDMDELAPGTQNNVVILAYGAPAISNGEYGTFFPGSSTYVSTAQIAAAVKEFGRGYWLCSGNDTTSSVRILVGTSNNSVITNAAHGSAWANMINGIGSYLVSIGASSQAQVDGAIDVELAWSNATAVYDWLSGYDSVNQYLVYNFGDAAGCPESGQTNVSRNCVTETYTWTQEQIYWVSYGAQPAKVIPQVYNRGGAQARQWQQIKLYAKLQYPTTGFTFSGVLTQYESCLTQLDCGPVQNCVPLGACTNNKPQEGYTQFSDALNADSRTAQSLPWVTDVTWNSDPAVNP
jgi:hypothetical protein